MSNKAQIFLLCSTSNYHEIFTDILSDYEVKIFTDSNQLNDVLKQDQPDIALLSVKDINNTLLESSLLPQNTIYLTTDAEEEADLKGEESCRIDVLKNPYGHNLFSKHLKTLLEKENKKDENDREIGELTGAVLMLQNDNAKLQDINRFLQHSFFCPDITGLCEQFFAVTNSFGTSSTLYIHSGQHNFFISDDGTDKELNNNILTMLKDESRIYQFGKDRAVFNWSCASLLVSKVDSDVDNLAILMDGFEIGFNAIESAEEFDLALKHYREDNQQLNTSVSRVVENLAIRINEQLALFGAETSLTLEQEEALMEIAEESRNSIDVLFSDYLAKDEQLTTAMTKMRTQKEDTSATTVEEDDIEFF